MLIEITGTLKYFWSNMIPLRFQRIEGIELIRTTGSWIKLAKKFNGFDLYIGLG